MPLWPATPSSLLRLGPVQRHEARAEALDAGEILVAGGLVDLALAPQFGLERQHGDAVRFDAAVTAALADLRIDEGALVGIGESAALAPPALFGCAGLVIDHGAHAADLGEVLLHRHQVAAMVDL